MGGKVWGGGLTMSHKKQTESYNMFSTALQLLVGARIES